MQIGFMDVEVVPCDSSGREFNENDDRFVDNPEQLIGSSISFRIKIIGCSGLPNKYKVFTQTTFINNSAK